jgi:hypothetical protein
LTKIWQAQGAQNLNPSGEEKNCCGLHSPREFLVGDTVAAVLAIFIGSAKNCCSGTAKIH